MPIQLPEVPLPPDPQVRRFTADGKPTDEQIRYDTRLRDFLAAVKQVLESI